VNTELHFMSSYQTNENGIDWIERYRREDDSTLQNRSKYNRTVQNSADSYTDLHNVKY
jgi:hypothetical protein